MNVLYIDFEENMRTLLASVVIGQWAGGSKIRILAGAKIFLSSTTSKTAFGPTHPPVRSLPGDRSLEL